MQISKNDLWNRFHKLRTVLKILKNVELWWLKTWNHAKRTSFRIWSFCLKGHARFFRWHHPRQFDSFWMTPASVPCWIDKIWKFEKYQKWKRWKRTNPCTFDMNFVTCRPQNENLVPTLLKLLERLNEFPKEFFTPWVVVFGVSSPTLCKQNVRF